MEQKFKYRKFKIRAFCTTSQYRGHHWYSSWGYNERDAIEYLRKRYRSVGRVTHIVDSDTPETIKCLVPDSDKDITMPPTTKSDPLSRWHPDVLKVASTPEFATMCTTKETTFASAIVVESVLRIAKSSGLTISEVVLALGYELSSRYLDETKQERKENESDSH